MAVVRRRCRMKEETDGRLHAVIDEDPWWTIDGVGFFDEGGEWWWWWRTREAGWRAALPTPRADALTRASSGMMHTAQQQARSSGSSKRSQQSAWPAAGSRASCAAVIH